MKRLGMEDLLHLNQEILALTSAHVPIASQLSGSALRLSSASTELSQSLRTRLESGQSLDEAVGDEELLPPFYAAIVKAGVTANRLPAALEAFGLAYTRLIDLRRIVVASLLYPIGIVYLAWTILVFAAHQLLPAYAWIDLGDLGLGFFSSSARVFALLLAPLLLGAVGLLWARRRSAGGILGEVIGPFRWLPGTQGVLRLTSYATYTEVLGLLTRQGVSLPEALPLAGAAAGDPSLDRVSREIGDLIAAGQTPGRSSPAFRVLPPQVTIGLAMAAAPTQLATHLGWAAEQYDKRARAAADRLAIYFPTLSTALLGGAAVSVYGFLMLGPYISALLQLSTWR